MMSMDSIESKLSGWKKNALIFGVFGLLVLSYVCYKWLVSPNRNNSKLIEVQRLSSETPVHPSFKNGGSNYSYGFDLANVTKYFYTSADYHEVKDFYSAELSQRGWILSKENPIGRSGKELTFSKGEFSIVIYYVGKGSNVGYDCAINYLWKNSAK